MKAPRRFWIWLGVIAACAIGQAIIVGAIVSSNQDVIVSAVFE